MVTNVETTLYEKNECRESGEVSTKGEKSDVVTKSSLVVDEACEERKWERKWRD